ncbi:MAG: hypothetical protein ACYDC3_08300 [Candidatus Binataceae bacterium]
MQAERTYPLAAVPTFDELIANPALALTLPPATAAVLLGRVGIATAALQARLLAAVVEQNKPSVASEPEKMITVAEAAERLRRVPRWFYRHASQLPFVRRISRKTLLISEPGLAKWLERKSNKPA